VVLLSSAEHAKRPGADSDQPEHGEVCKHADGPWVLRGRREVQNVA